MLRFVLVALVFAVTYWAIRRAKAAREGSLPRALGFFAVAALVTHGLTETWKVAAFADVRPLLVAAAAASGLVTWWAVARLVHEIPRRRDPWFRVPVFLAAAAVALTGGNARTVAGFTIAALLCWRWKDRFSTVALFRLAFAAIGLSALLLYRAPGAAPEFDSGSTPGVLAQFALWARGIALFYALLGVVALFAGFVRDPSLGIRRVGRRLALSHLLVVLVPLALTLALWAVTTVVGIGAERARTAAHALGREAGAMDHALRAALAVRGSEDRALVAVASAYADSFPGTRLWIVRSGGARLAFGAPSEGDTAVIAWFAAPDSVPSRGVASFGMRTWVAARAGDAGANGAVLAAPVGGLAAGIASRITGGRVRLSGGFDDDELERVNEELERLGPGTADADRRDSLAALRDSIVDEMTRSVTSSAGARNRPQLRIVNDGDTITALAPREDSTTSGLFDMPTGSAAVPGAAWRAGTWRQREFVLTVHVGARDILFEMVRRAGRGDLDVVPLVLVGLFGSLLALVALFDLVMVVNMGRSITAAIGALRDGARRLQAGDLGHRIEVTGRDDLWDVARAFNEASEGLERARDMEKERDRLENELALARRIQARLLPSAPPVLPGWDIAGGGESAREVGGDYYDHIDLGGGRLVLVIADVSGKGVPASLLMSAFRAALVSQDLAAAEPTRVASRLNEFLHASVEPGRFVTAFVAFLDGATGRVVFVNAGHNPPLLLRAGGAHEWLTEGGTILGILPSSVFTAGETTMEPGDLLALYTDGVTEGADATGDMWGEERLLAATRRRSGLAAPAIVAETVAEVREFEGASGPADDITMLVAKRLGAAPPAA